ncbi:MAG TPA: LysR substrate-binding domain-containing protein, partial [Pyrinomonadaceae bacterium]|nr:LysR substrate-binding domain-containing protein [Pyrinomonadaceae bacterium]
VDLALLATEPRDRAIEAFPILKDELILILSPKHPLARRGRAVTIKELGHESFLAHNVRAGSRLKVVETFAKQRTPLNITLELATIETIKRFVQQQVGIAFVPRMCVREELERGTLATLPVRGLTYRRTLWAAHRRSVAFSPAVAEFVRILRQHAKD